MSGDLLDVISPDEFNERAQITLPEVVEDADSFVGNALLKAASGLRASSTSTLSDDSGLCVSALDDRPGVLSARFAGEGASDADNLHLLLEQLAGTPAEDRQARFECALVVAGPLAEGKGCGRTEDGIAWRAFTGTTHGVITERPTGESGFGYDPVFFSPHLGKTFAEASGAEKHAVSHRGAAFAKLMRYVAARAELRQRRQRPLFIRPIGMRAIEAAFAELLARRLRYADTALASALRARPHLGSKERAAISEMFWWGIRRLDRLQLAVAALEGANAAGIADSAQPDPRKLPAAAAPTLGPLIAASLDLHGAELPLAGARKPSALDGLLARSVGFGAHLRHKRPALIKALRKAKGRLKHSAERPGYHAAFTNTVVAERGSSYAAQVFEYLDGRAPLTLRAADPNKGKELVDELARANFAAVQTSPRGAVLCLRSARVTTLDGYISGQFEIQDAGSQAVAAAVDARPGEVIADWCAGAGGKALALAAQMRGQGQLFALDVHPGRLNECRRRLKRAGQLWVTVHKHSRGDGPDTRLPPLDAVLVDAPCSSTGALRRNPELRWHLDDQWLTRFPAQQLDILQRAAAHVRPGGRVIYATCSVMKAENEDVVAAFLARNPRWSLQAFRREGPANPALLAQWPLAEMEPDGFYSAVLTAPEDSLT